MRIASSPSNAKVSRQFPFTRTAQCPSMSPHRGSRRDTIFDTGPEYGIIIVVETVRKITVEVPPELLEKAQQASGTGITQTVRTGLQLVAASLTYARLRQLRGKVRFTRTLAELKADR
jgi:hypothetical protein